MDRRSFLGGAAALPLVLGLPAQAAVDAPGLKPGETFSREALVAYARALAKQTYQAADATLPAQFTDLDYAKYVAIRFRPERAIWSAERHGFTVEPLHRGFIYSAPVDLYTVEDGRVLRIAYDASLFDFGTLDRPDSSADLGYSGFRLKAQTPGASSSEEFAIFQGASYFRAVARAQTYGAVGRGLAINTGEPTGEQFPFFRSFWIERPAAEATRLVMHALLDSEAATGAYTLTVSPGDFTIIDVNATIVPRLRIEHAGIAPLNSMYFFGANDRKGVDDVRLAVHESSGLQMLTGAGEWIWRPLQNPETLQLSSFQDKNPKGFGLIQRNRDVAAFEDDSHRYERQPSVWIQPRGDWGEGAVQLVEIPSDLEIHDNIVAYWRPKNPLEAGKDFSFAYSTTWCWATQQHPPGAVAHETRVGSGGGRSRRFVIDFEGDVFRDPVKLAGITPSVSVNPGKLRDVVFTPEPERGIGRLSFELDPGGNTYVEMRAMLLQNNAPVTETWLYRWTP